VVDATTSGKFSEKKPLSSLKSVSKPTDIGAFKRRWRVHTERKKRGLDWIFAKTGIFGKIAIWKRISP
jgi:hypothetical protein